MKLRLLMAGLSAAGTLAGGHAASAPAAPATATPVATTTTTASSSDCDAGAWHTDGISVTGRPDNFRPTATYIWHDATGWHLRTSGANDKVHVFSGRVTVRGGSFTSVEKVRDEADDRVVQQGGTIYYRFVTYRAVDGFDFRVSGCSAAEHEVLAFGARLDGAADATRVIVGDQGRHPERDPLYVTRSL